MLLKKMLLASFFETFACKEDEVYQYVLDHFLMCFIDVFYNSTSFSIFDEIAAVSIYPLLFHLEIP